MVVKKANPVHVEIGDVWVDVSIRETHGVGAEVTDHPVERGANIADHIRPTARTFSIEGLITNHPIEVPKSHMGGARQDTSPLEIQSANSQPARVPPQSITIQGEPSIGAFGLIPGVDQGVALLGALRIEVRSKRVFAAEHNKIDNQVKQAYSGQALHFTQSFDRVGEVHAALVNMVESSKLVTVVTGLMRYDSVALTDLQFERSAEIGKHALKFTAQARVLRIVDSQVVKLPDPVQPRAKPAQSDGKQAPVKTSTSTSTVATNDGEKRTGLSKAAEATVAMIKDLIGG
jgi:hypothetical protein